MDNEMAGWWLRRSFIRHWRKCRICQRMVEIQKGMKELLQKKCGVKKAPVELKNKIHNLISENK